MAASDRQIKRDAAGQPVPQVFDEVADDYQVAKGTNGRQHAILYTANGQAVDLAALVADMAATKAAAVATQVASEAIRAAVEGTLITRVSGSSIDLRGPLANRPAANAVDVGTTYWAIDRVGEADELSVSDGSTWVNV